MQFLLKNDDILRGGCFKNFFRYKNLNFNSFFQKKMKKLMKNKLYFLKLNT